MTKLLFALLAAMLVMAGHSFGNKAEAAPVGVLPLSNSYSPIEKVGCWCGPYRCACRRAWRRGYPYYGGYAYRPYGYYGYGYRPYGYYGYGWRPGVSIHIGPGWAGATEPSPSRQQRDDRIGLLSLR
jgi:hypothetical protein